MAIKVATKPAKKRISPITIENAQMIYKNFAGIGKKYNAKGLRNFNVILDSEVAKMLQDDGWNVKWKEGKEEGDEPQARLKVAVSFDNFPPRMLLFTKDSVRGTVLDEDSVDILDYAEIEKADIVLNGSAWTNDEGQSGIKAWLGKGFFTLAENDLESKYHRPTPRRKDDDED